MNRRGFVALADAVIFTVVVMMALSALIGLGIQEQSDDRDAGGLLETLMSAEVRMSDLVEGGDGSLVRVSDLCALMLTGDQPGVENYVESVLESFSGGRHYLLEMRHSELSMTIGTASGTPSVSAETEVPVTTGGVLWVRLSLFPS